MSWYSIREYTDRMGVSISTVRRQIQEGRLFAKKFGKHWYIQPPDGAVSAAPEPTLREEVDDLHSATLVAPQGSNVTSIVEFSSKALHHYLLMSEKLIAEKDIRLKEREQLLSEKKQEVADLEAYVKILENELTRQKDRPEGWR
ncbi:MAG: helix-turn-helix domain-containing protein [Pseudomonadota bacterium]